MEFDVGDLGAIGQELIWAAISFAGATRAWLREGGWTKFVAGKNCSYE